MMAHLRANPPGNSPPNGSKPQPERPLEGALRKKLCQNYWGGEAPTQNEERLEPKAFDNYIQAIAEAGAWAGSVEPHAFATNANYQVYVFADRRAFCFMKPCLATATGSDCVSVLCFGSPGLTLASYWPSV